MARLDKTGLQYLLDKIHTFLNRFSLKSETVFSVNEETPVDGNVTLNEVPYAGNLVSENAQVSRADVLVRTSGGDASISDGDAWLVRLLGNREYSVPPVSEVLEMTVDPIEREEPITAVIDRDTFVGYVENSTVLDFYYTTEWSANLSLYGITVTGEPVSGDHISVNYVKADRGVIVQSTPSAFVSTGWNLYNASTGRAMAVKYSEQYGFKIGGAYTSVSFVEEIGDTPTPITVVSGNFTVPSDGWIIVSGGDSTTYVYMTWSDWTEEPAGNFEMYTQSVIDLSTVMVNFPNGLMRAGNVRDEINLNTLVATSNVERLSYNASNLEIAEQSGREYEVDRDYIYIAKATTNTYSISVSGAYIANDHGIEFVDGTTIPVFIETLYGNNLKNKLERDVLTISKQTLTSAQQAQVLANIGAASSADLGLKSSASGVTGNDAFSKIASLNSKITNMVIEFGTSSKDLTPNLTDNWRTAVPNDSRVYFVRINSMYGAFYGVICRYSDVYGTGIVSRYDGQVYRIQMNNGSCSSYQLQNRPIQVLSTGSKTISGNGNISYTFENKVLVLGVYSTSSDIVCSAYPSSGADSSGSATWWIHCRNANSSGSVASGTITCYIIYIDMA